MTILAALIAAGCGSSRRVVADASSGDTGAWVVPLAQSGTGRLAQLPSAALRRSSPTATSTPRGSSPHATPGASSAPSAPSAPRAATTAAPTAASAIAALASGGLATALDRLPRGTSAVASAGAVPVSVYRSPLARSPERQFSAQDQFGTPRVFLVKRAIPGWLQVYLPVRPNGSTAWVRSTSVGLTLDPYWVLVDTARHELTTLRAGRVVMHTAVGVGKAATPTPHGLFYVLDSLKMVPGTGPYGTYAFATSAYSNVLQTFGNGPAQVALHGTNAPSTIGQNTSNGCIHMSDTVAGWMARTVPLGTPVQIV